jgi:hypothetical protein
MNNKDEMSAMDSWISFAPDKGIALNVVLQEKWIQKTRDFRNMRGDILTSSFEIENLLDEIISEVFFPGLNSAPGDNADAAEVTAYVSKSVLKSVFSRLFLKTSANTFGRKVGLFKDISNEVKALGDLLTDQLKGDLKNIVTVRNAFAHYPITFEIAGDEENPDFAAVILIAGEIIELTQPVCEGHKSLITSVIAMLRDVFENLKANPNREGDSPLSRDGIIWMGHTALTDDAWQVRDSDRPLDLWDFYLRASRPNLKMNINIPGEDSDENKEAAKNEG